MKTYRSPGVYKEEIFPLTKEDFKTGVPVFLGYTSKLPSQYTGKDREPVLINLWSEFEENFGTSFASGYLSSAVHGFFLNGGSQCYILPLDKNDDIYPALLKALKELETLDSIDLVCVPDLVSSENNHVYVLQKQVLDHCNRMGDRFAILDPLPGSDRDMMVKQSRYLITLNGPNNGAIYYPFIKDSNTPDTFIPPCGHVAGIYSATDRSSGVHSAPANESLKGVIDMEYDITSDQQEILNPQHINCLRAFPGRGIRIWGARTLSKHPDWIYVNVRRLFLTVGRYIERRMVGVVFNPNDPKLWVRISRELTTYFRDLFMKGALKGGSVNESFYIKCDSETNPPEIRDAGMVVTEIGLAPSVPSEFVVVRIIHGASGVTINVPSGTS